MARNEKTIATRKTASPSKNASSKNAAYNEQTKLKELFVDELKDIYWAEKHLSKALPKLAKAATSNELADAFMNHQEQTENHVQRIEQVFEMMALTARAKKCEAMEGLVKEGQTAIEDTDKGTATRDAALIIAAQKAEHYEIASYGSMVQLAKTMGRDDVANVLQQTLDEEKQTDVHLTQLAVSSININAENEPE